MKLNVGSGKKKIEGYLNMDGLEWDGVTDIVHGITDIPWLYGDQIMGDDSVEEILMVEVLEHIPFRETLDVLRECNRVLVAGGLIHIQVPDIGAMCRMYAEKKICSCVPRKASSYDEYKADPDCLSCGGKAEVHPERFWFALSGAQKHRFDAHLAHFDRSKLARMLHEAGFVMIQFEENIYKVVIKARKKL